jgi:hypothetical protein
MGTFISGPLHDDYDTSGHIRRNEIDFSTSRTICPGVLGARNVLLPQNDPWPQSDEAKRGATELLGIWGWGRLSHRPAELSEVSSNG